MKNIQQYRQIKSNLSWQYIIRKKKEEEEKLLTPFQLKDVHLKNSHIKLIKRKDCIPIIKNYEYLGCLPAFSKYHFGIYFNIDCHNYLVGVIMYGDDYSTNLGHWDKYNFTSDPLLLSRGACVWWTPKNTASYFISRANDWIAKNTNYRVITATVDKSANEIGIIYQSLNWYYLGSLRASNPKVKSNGKRFAVIINDKLYGARSIRNKLGTQKKSVILKKYPDAIFTFQYEKQRYFTFIGNKKERKHNLKGIQHLIKSYPKKINGNKN